MRRTTRRVSRRRKLEPIGDEETGVEKPTQELSTALPTHKTTAMVSRRKLTLSGSKNRQSSVISIVVGVWFLLILAWVQATFDPLHITRRVDHNLTYRIMRRHFAELDSDLKRYGVHLPSIKIAKANEIRTNAALRQTLLNRALRRHNLERLARESTTCHNRRCTVPNVLFSPIVDGKFVVRPTVFSQHNTSSVTFDVPEMRAIVSQVANQTNRELIHLYDNLTDEDERKALWALCVVYQYGGICVMGSVPSFSAEDRFAGRLSAFVMTAVSSKVLLLAAPPLHPFLSCVLKQSPQVHSISQSILDFMPHEQSTLDRWLRFDAHSNGCKLQTRDLIQSHSDDTATTVYLRIAAEGDDSVIPNETSMTRTAVEFHSADKRAQFTSTKRSKLPLQGQLHSLRSEPGWLCNRCLNYAGLGTYELCRPVCPSGYEQLLCQPIIDSQTIITVLHMTVRRPAVYTQRIPRIIHQTFFEEVNFESFPHLARLQASWKNSGWEYRFYTDTTAREFIAQHFPPPFVEAFDAIIHGAYKADFFRYLVLLIDGGIYADIDVLLETTLDTFITPEVSFFGPRDIPCEYAGEAFCIWNGLLGAEPGHPIVVRAVERMVNLIQHRADMYDMEQEICQRNGPSASIWKLRAQPLLFLTGPCGLGVALNEAMGKGSLASVPLGWSLAQNREAVGDIDHGDVLILVGDKHDLGEFRFSDPERNFIVASTDLQDLDRSRFSWETEGTSRGRHANRLHYSNSRKYMRVWGSDGVYVDDEVTDETIHISASYSQA